MEILISSTQIVILDLLILLEVFLILKHYFIFHKEITHPDQQIARNRAYRFMVYVSEPSELFGTLILIYFLQRDISNFFVDGVSLVVFFGVLFSSMIYRERYIERLVKNDINRLYFPHTAIARDCTKALFMGMLINLTLQTYVYLSRISLVAAMTAFVFSALAFIIVIPILYRFVKNRPYPELNLNRKFKWLD